MLYEKAKSKILESRARSMANSRNDKKGFQRNSLPATFGANEFEAASGGGHNKERKSEVTAFVPTTENAISSPASKPDVSHKERLHTTIIEE